jgi:hypothetical protein
MRPVRKIVQSLAKNSNPQDRKTPISPNCARNPMNTSITPRQGSVKHISIFLNLPSFQNAESRNNPRDICVDVNVFHSQAARSMLLKAL